MTPEQAKAIVVDLEELFLCAMNHNAWTGMGRGPHATEQQYIWDQRRQAARAELTDSLLEAFPDKGNRKK